MELIALPSSAFKSFLDRLTGMGVLRVSSASVLPVTDKSSYFLASKNTFPSNFGSDGTILSSANQMSFSLARFRLASNGFHLPLSLSVSTTRLTNLMLCSEDANKSLYCL